MNSQVPSPTPAERSAPDFDAMVWAHRHGVCAYHGGEHQFAGKSYCRLCREERSWLKAQAKDGILYSAD